jgi:hypothetical protein
LLDHSEAENTCEQKQNVEELLDDGDRVEISVANCCDCGSDEVPRCEVDAPLGPALKLGAFDPVQGVILPWRLLHESDRDP